MSPEEDRTRDTVDSEPKHDQLSYSGPLSQAIAAMDQLAITAEAEVEQAGHAAVFSTCLMHTAKELPGQLRHLNNLCPCSGKFGRIC